MSACVCCYVKYLTISNAELWILWTDLPTCRTDREYLCDPTFDARRRKNTVFWTKTQDEPCAWDLLVHTRWAVCNASISQTTKKMIKKCLLIYLLLPNLRYIKKLSLHKLFAFIFPVLNMVNRDSSCVGLSLLLYVVM